MFNLFNHLIVILTLLKEMLQTGLSHGVAIIPNAPKQRFSDPVTGAHFEFEDMCVRLEKLKKKRF